MSTIIRTFILVSSRPTYFNRFLDLSMFPTNIIPPPHQSLFVILASIYVAPASLTLLFWCEATFYLSESHTCHPPASDDVSALISLTVLYLLPSYIPAPGVPLRMPTSTNVSCVCSPPPLSALGLRPFPCKPLRGSPVCGKLPLSLYSCLPPVRALPLLPSQQSRGGLRLSPSSLPDILLPCHL